MILSSNEVFASVLFPIFTHMKNALLIAGLMLLLASCTQKVTPSPTSVAPKVAEESKMISDEKKMDMKMMTGEKTEWTKEEMDAMEKDHMMMSGSDMKMDSMKKEEMMKTESMVKPVDTMMKEEVKMMKLSGYMSYDESKVKEALASGQKVALFFYAAWCPTCRALDTAINTNLSLIPQDALIVKVDYDTSDALKQKYEVTSQHTTVVIDKDMNLVSKKLGAKNVVEALN
jgi:thiol-disulfide isomerase/thioredoxin